MGTTGFIYCFAGRAGKIVGSGYIAFIRKRDLTYVANDRAEVNPLHIDWNGPN
jgi:hypothetical protein